MPGDPTTIYAGPKALTSDIVQLRTTQITMFQAAEALTRNGVVMAVDVNNSPFTASGVMVWYNAGVSGYAFNTLAQPNGLTIGLVASAFLSGSYPIVVTQGIFSASTPGTFDSQPGQDVFMPVGTGRPTLNPPTGSGNVQVRVGYNIAMSLSGGGTFFVDPRPPVQLRG